MLLNMHTNTKTSELEFSMSQIRQDVFTPKGAEHNAQTKHLEDYSHECLCIKTPSSGK